MSLPDAIAPNLNDEPALPLVVQVAFVGRRRLLDPIAHADVDPAAFDAALGVLLTDRMRRLPAELGLGARHKVCALSSLAAGADFLFAQACQTLGWWHRVLLPQPREDFLTASGSQGRDFTDEEARRARRMLDGNLVIEERVVSLAAERGVRFEDVNLALVRECDVLVCLGGAGTTPPGRGGTQATRALAKRWGRPVLALTVAVQADGVPVLSDDGAWSPRSATATGDDDLGTVDAPKPLEGFSAPRLPPPLDGMDCARCDLIDAKAYRKTLKSFASTQARRLQNRFRWAALVIVGLHVLATALALAAMKTQGELALRWLLGVELAFLAASLSYHEWLHRSHSVRHWAMARLSAESARSATWLAGVPRALHHLDELPMPESLRPLLRTLNVLQLAGLRDGNGDWDAPRNDYVQQRLRSAKDGQLPYYQSKLAQARRWRRVATASFYLCSAGAFVATATKLAWVSGWWPSFVADPMAMIPLAGYLAVLLPVLAVAALSLASAFDLEAREHTYKDMLSFLNDQVRLLEAAKTENEFAGLALETESRLLGETARWYDRRSFTGVA